jgi:hypothetical protein
MEISNIRNLYNIHWSKIVAILFLFCSAFSANAQLSGSGGNYNYFEFQKKPFYFGISLGVNNAKFRINHSRNFVANDSINVAQSAGKSGFHINIITNMKIGEHFDFRVLPGFSFSERVFEFTSALDEGALLTRSIESVFFEIPLQLRFKSEAYKDKKAFVVGGLKYSYDVQSNSNTRQASSLINISPHDFQVEVGAGMQFFFPYFIFSPEIKFSRGISNILIFNDNINESNILEQLGSQVFSISFHFEG